MQYPISVGLDVHKNSIVACAIDIETGEVARKKFGYDVDELSRWLFDFDKPLTCVYESGFCGFHLQRELVKLGYRCVVAAISKLPKAKGNKIKTDKRDAEFLARQLMAGQISEVWVPDAEMEGMRDIARAYESIADDLKKAKQRLGAMCTRYGLRYGKTKSLDTKTYDEWLRTQRMPSSAAQSAFDAMIAHADALKDEKERLFKEIEGLSTTERFKKTVDALCLLIGIKPVTAFRLIAEIGDFARFKTARGFAAYLGLVPSENSSGDSTSRGRITKSGNSHVRKLLIEISWTFIRAKNAAKKERGVLRTEVIAHARKGNRRLMRKRHQLIGRNKNSCVANTATAREFSMWIWSVAVMA
jgi:transposase